MAISQTFPRDVLGLSIIGGKRVDSSGRTFQKESPTDLSVLGDVNLATEAQVEAALASAWKAYWQDTVLAPSNRLQRAAMLEAVAAELEKRKEDLRITYGAESALPTAPGGRFDIEFSRTVNQLLFHALRLKDHTHFIPILDVTPSSDIRKTRRGIGPVLVLGAINFPLAFSTAGGDFADAWASGCPVIMKAHAEHPFTSEIVGACIAAALEKLGVDQGWFSLIHCKRELTLKIVADDRIHAVALTGSLHAAESIKAVASRYNKPVYAECGSSNPVFVFPDYLAANAVAFADAYTGSVCMGAGQFCTCPGLCIVVESSGYSQFRDRVAEVINGKPAATMLSRRTRSDFRSSVAKLMALNGVSVLAGGKPVEHPCQSTPVILEISASDFLAQAENSQQEAFGQCSMIVRASSIGQAFAIATALSGNLTATRYGTPNELGSADGMRLRRILELKAGRQISEQMPTGVAVCAAMNHGGPFPACTINSSSVGGSERFMVAVTFQNEPDQNLPRELQRSNPDRVMRLVNGQYTDSMLST